MFLNVKQKIQWQKEWQKHFNLHWTGQDNVLQLKLKPKTMELTAFFRGDIKLGLAEYLL